jgi:hypothetical protein
MVDGGASFGGLGRKAAPSGGPCPTGEVKRTKVREETIFKLDKFFTMA